MSQGGKDVVIFVSVAGLGLGDQVNRGQVCVWKGWSLWWSRRLQQVLPLCQWQAHAWCLPRWIVLEHGWERFKGCHSEIDSWHVLRKTCKTRTRHMHWCVFDRQHWSQRVPVSLTLLLSDLSSEFDTLFQPKEGPRTSQDISMKLSQIKATLFLFQLFSQLSNRSFTHSISSGLTRPSDVPESANFVAKALTTLLILYLSTWRLMYSGEKAVLSKRYSIACCLVHLKWWMPVSTTSLADLNRL